MKSEAETELSGEGADADGEHIAYLREQRQEHIGDGGKSKYHCHEWKELRHATILLHSTSKERSEGESNDSDGALCITDVLKGAVESS